MRLAIFLLAASCAFGQIEMNFSRQAPELVKAPLHGTVPKNVFVYRVDIRNVGDSEARIFPDRAGFEASKVAPQQDPAAALYAARAHNSGSKWSVLTGLASMAIPYAGVAVPMLKAFGLDIPNMAVGMTGGAAGIKAMLDGLHNDASKLDLPTQILMDGMPEIILRPGQGAAYWVFLGGDPPGTFTATVAAKTIQPQPAQPAMPAASIQPTAFAGVTHPQVDDDDYGPARVAALIRAHTAEREAANAVGAVQ